MAARLGKGIDAIGTHANLSGVNRFPTTRRSAVAALGAVGSQERERAWTVLVAAYYPPARAYVSRRWNADPDEAEDLVQGFFASAYEHGFIARFDHRKARFRTWLRVGLDGWVANARRSTARLKRGGGAVHVPLDGDLAEVLPAALEDPDAWFEREWARTLFALAVDALRERYAARHGLRLRLFERHDLVEDEAPSYRTLAEAEGIAVTDVTNHLAAARRDLRALVLERLRALTVDDEEFRAEARRLLGADPA